MIKSLLKKLNLSIFILSLHFILSSFLLHTCSMDNVVDAASPNQSGQFTGTIYFNFAGKYGYINLKENKYVQQFATTKDFGKIDIGANNKHILLITTKGISGTDHQRIVYRPLSSAISLTNLSDNKNKIDFKYQWSNIGIGSGTQSYISPNEKFIAINAESSGNHSVALVNAQTGETIETFRDKNFSLRDHKIIGWTADNSLLINVSGSVFKIHQSSNWEPVSLVKIPSTHAAVNPQGTKLVFRAEKHLFLCNTDGSNIRQITDSKTLSSLTEDGERLPAFSPDGKYIAFSSKAKGAAASWENPIDGSVVATASSFGYLTIIPADGKLYNIDAANNSIIYPKDSAGKLIAVDGEFFWR